MNHLAYLFPGQGSQHLGMLAELASIYPIIENQFAEASERLGYDVWQLAQQGPEEQLNQTEFTQALMLTADVALFRLAQQLGLPQPKFMAGHSLGEYAALVAANALTLPDAAQLVRTRGQLMQQFIPLGQGAMAAVVGLSDQQVAELCSEVSQPESQVTPANYNAIGQVVIAGHTSAVERAVLLAEDKGARLAKIIPVSVPCHCPLLLQAAQAFAETLQATTFTLPDTAVISNVDLSIYQSVPQIKTLLAQQLHQPVRWVETIQLMQRSGVNAVIECGPGKVLNGLVKRIERSISTFSIQDKTGLDQTLAHFCAKSSE